MCILMMRRLAAACHRSEALRRLLAQRSGQGLGAAREGEEGGGLRRPFGMVSSPSRGGAGGFLVSTAQHARALGGSTRAMSSPSGALSRPRHGAAVGGAGVGGGGVRVTTTGRGCHALGGGERLSSSREVGRSGAMPSFSSGMRGSARSSGGGGVSRSGGGGASCAPRVLSRDTTLPRTCPDALGVRSTPRVAAQGGVGSGERAARSDDQASARQRESERERSRSAPAPQSSLKRRTSRDPSPSDTSRCSAQMWNGRGGVGGSGGREVEVRREETEEKGFFEEGNSEGASKWRKRGSVSYGERCSV